ncbi:MAG: orotidine-5'-phosphate decarboxylase [Acidimicrobiales bacterium]
MSDVVHPATREHLALALDVDDLVVADRLATAMRPWFGVAKVGLELWAAAGPEVIGVVENLGYRVFCDLKLHDIPNTVNRACRVIGALGVSYVTLHAQGGADMLRAGVEGLLEGSGDAGLDPPLAVAVTVLTSDGQAPDHIVPSRLRAALEGGCGGVVCSAADLRDARTLAPALARIVPGIRPTGVDRGDQRRVATPADAIADGADLLVIGRAVIAADDPAASAAAIAAEVSGALDRRA